MSYFHRITNDELEDAAKGYPYAYRSVVESTNKQIAQILISLKQDVLRLEAEKNELREYINSSPLLSYKPDYKMSIFRRAWIKCKVWFWTFRIVRKRRVRSS